MPKDEKRASRVSEHRGSVTGGRRASTKDGALRRSSSALIDSTGKEELHERVGLVEDTVQACQQEIKSIREDLALLPALCYKLGVELADLDAVDTGESLCIHGSDQDKKDCERVREVGWIVYFLSFFWPF